MEKYEHGEAPKEDIFRDFTVNANPLGMRGDIIDAACESICGSVGHEDAECREICAMLSEIEKTDPENIFCGNGAADLIYRTVFASAPKKALIFAPSISEFERALEAAGCECDRCLLKEENGFLPSDDFSDCIRGHDMVFISSPNDLTGISVPYGQLFDIAEKCREEGAAAVIDMSCLYYCENREEYDINVLADKGCIIIRSLESIIAAKGLKFAYLICKDRKLINRIRLCGQKSSVSLPAQAAAAAALRSSELIPKTVEYAARERRYLTEKLQELGIKVFPSEADFLLVRYDKDLNEILRSHNMLLLSCADFMGLGEQYFRISLRDHENNVKLIYALGRELSEGDEPDPNSFPERWKRLFHFGFPDDFEL